ncbi:hypothetical protein GCM10010095_21670 [Streptomyces anthocyanicus]|uniref:hypothetical protein n=1 Tax=Streptomyces anthocyanicus TaxID=68174 RepID=UPI0016717503|nr:hypothetical protein [Streptomyces anthocyanicus]GGL36095.1 hypothetical protein GCM10010095_21670 [Streptomyces anthocyanicus]
MIDTILPPLFAVAAFALTYFFCVRPMMKGRGCHMMPGQSQAGQSSCHSTAASGTTAQTSAPDSTDAEIKRLRAEVQLLHHELDLRATKHPTDAVRFQKDESR